MREPSVAASSTSLSSRRAVFVQTLVHRLDELLQRVLRKVAVLVVDRLDARAIHRQQLAPEKIEFPAQQRELAEHGAESGSIVAPEVGDVLKSGFKVRNSQITSMLRWHSASSRRLDRTRLR